MRIETSRLLVTFIVLAAFLFGQATALEHAAQYGGQVHSIAAHMDGDDNSDDDGTLCDLSLFSAGHHLTFDEGPAVCVTTVTVQLTFVPTNTALLGSVFITGPPVRGPPSLS